MKSRIQKLITHRRQLGIALALEVIDGVVLEEGLGAADAVHLRGELWRAERDKVSGLVGVWVGVCGVLCLLFSI